jgi:hypothetical protein
MNTQRELSGVLFKNEKKTSAKHPDYRGSATIDGTEYWLSAWIKEGQRGKFMSLSFTDKSDQRGGASTAAARATEDDDIPF